MSVRPVTAHHAHSPHTGALTSYLKEAGPKQVNITCPVCGDEIMEARKAILHDNADYPFETQYFTHPECDSVNIGEAL